MPVTILAADGKRSYWATWTVVKDCRSQLGNVPIAERERDPSGCRASGLTTDPRGAASAATVSAAFARCGGYEKALNLTRAGQRIVQSTFLRSVFCSSGGIQAQTLNPTDKSQ